MVDILFTTNRTPIAPTAQGVPDFGDVALPATAGNLWCGTATVDNVDVADANAGTITKIPDLVAGGFSTAQIATVAQSGNPVLVFIHGAENSFADAVTRAAYNKSWLEQILGHAIDVIAFTWPSREYGNLINIFSDDADYHRDQTEASLSPFHFGLFLQQLYVLRPQLGARRLDLLCHSMGNYMLGFGVESWFASGGAPATPLFNQTILAAADETKKTFQTPNGGRLSRLAQLTQGIAVYFNYNDILMALSDWVNPFTPLGLDGPPGEANTQLFPRSVYQFVDCTNVDDYVGPETFDESHQYYRQSPTVRADIAALLMGQVPTRYYYDPNANVYSLFPAPILDV